MAAGLESGAEPEAISQSRWIRLALIWGAWSLIGLMFASQLYFALINTQKPISFSRALFSQFVPCYALALVTPGLLMFARRFPIERQNWRRSVVLHAVASITLGIALLTIQYVIEVAYLRGAQQMSRPDLLRFLIYNVDTQVGIYWLIILLSHAFRYYNRYRKGEVKSSQLEAMLVRSQLQALKMQLHPHFLFNTLHSISALLNRDTNAARSMIAALGDFLRLTLENQGAEEVTLEEEMEFLRRYLEIENIRFQDRLSVHMDLEPSVLELMVPNLILQPIVENAIRHGVAQLSGPGKIDIRAIRQDELLVIEVRDNGPGLPPNSTLSAHVEKGLGLANTMARLERQFGAAHLFKLANDPSGGLIVTLGLPLSQTGCPPAPPLRGDDFATASTPWGLVSR